ncbi:MAG: fumarylacetoacetate hydrolase family protein, partial [Phaeodactylibacter sp.]|nr:fumarylacetoacetate hydrolase family protein [Phaeodactylibacter sp.]
MKLYKTTEGILLEYQKQFYFLQSDWDELVNTENLRPYLLEQVVDSRHALDHQPADCEFLAPIESQEVWASGVTYLRSREARMDESKDAGGGDFYDRVYQAARPELFFKSLAHRVAGPGQPVRIRKDSHWNVPEPELTLLINNSGRIVGYTVGNDMSSRSIEGENPLYLPQAKCYDGSTAIGPCVYLCEGAFP